jgi:integrase-like protein
MKRTTQITDPTLKELLDALIERDLIPRSRIGPIKTAVKQYAIILGYTEPAECPLIAFHLPDQRRNRLIEERAEGSRRSSALGPHAIRNLKNHVSYLIRTAVTHEIIGQMPAQFANSKTTYTIKTNNITSRNESSRPGKYVVDPVPDTLAQELTDYEIWSTKLVNRHRPDSLKKRAISFSQHKSTLLRAAGYLVKFRRWHAKSISLSTLTEPDNAIGYIDWCIEQQGRFTRTAVVNLARLIVLGKYLSIIAQSPEQQKIFEQRVSELRKYRKTLGLPEPTVDKNKRWISLRNLETVGLSIYPHNARRLSELPGNTRNGLRGDKEGNFKRHTRYASRVLKSLLIRLTIRIPFRQRNLREMLWNPETPEQGRNLYKRDGKWYVRFHSAELKISHVQGKVHRVEHQFPEDLVALLEEWFSQWRPILISSQKAHRIGAEKAGSGQEFVFLDSVGSPLTQYQVRWAFESATYKFTGIAMNPHMVRTIWATEYIKSTKNFIDAAYMLGDKVETVLQSYADLLDEDCEKRAKSWLATALKNEPLSPNGNGHISNEKLVTMLRMLKTNLLEGNSDEQLLQSMKKLLN